MCRRIFVSGNWWQMYDGKDGHGVSARLPFYPSFKQQFDSIRLKSFTVQRQE